MMKNTPQLLQKYFVNLDFDYTNQDLDITQYEKIYDKMLINCDDAFDDICDALDVEALEWYYYNWYNDKTNFSYQITIESIIIELLEEDLLYDNNTKKFIDFYLRNFFDGESEIINEYLNNYNQPVDPKPFDPLDP